MVRSHEIDLVAALISATKAASTQSSLSNTLITYTICMVLIEFLCLLAKEIAMALCS